MNLSITRPNLLKVLILLFFGLFCLGQLQRMQLGPVAIYAMDVVIVTTLLIWAVDHRPVIKQFLKQAMAASRLGWALVAWVGVSLVVNFFLSDQSLLPFLYIVRLSIYTIFTYLIVNKITWWKELIIHFKPLHPGLVFFVYAGLFILYCGLLQYLILPDTRFLFALGWDEHYYRLISTLLDPAFTGMLLVLTWLGAQKVYRQSHWLTIVTVNVLLMLGIVLTYSRSSYLALGVGAVILIGQQLWQRRMVPVIPLACLAIFTFFIFAIPRPAGEGGNLLRTSTVTARSTNATESVSVLRPYQWLIGRGLFSPLPETQARDAQEPLPDHAQVPDNLFIMITTGLGIGGSGLLLAWLWQQRPQFKNLPSWFVASLAAVLVSSLFNNTLFQPFVWLWMTAAWWLAKLQSKGNF